MSTKSEMSVSEKNRLMYLNGLNANLACESLMSDDEGKAIVYNACLANFLYDAVDEFMKVIPSEVREDVRRLAYKNEIRPWKLNRYITSDFFDSDGLPTG